MICLIPADRSPALLDACLNLARQMTAADRRVLVDAAMAPADLSRGQKYEMAVFAADPLAGAPVSHIMVVGAERIGPDAVDRLRGLTQAKLKASVVAVGRFAEPGSRISAQAKVAYTIGSEPVVIDLDDFFGPPVLAHCATPALCPPVPPAPHSASATTLVVHASAERLSDPAMAQALSVLRSQPDLRLITLPETGEGDRLRAATAGQLCATDPGEISPEGIARLADAVAFFDAPAGDERLAGLIICAIAQGKPVLDCTEARALCATGAPVLSGPDEPGALWPYLERTVLANLGDISRFITSSPWHERHALHRFLLAAGIAQAPAAALQMAKIPTPRTVFLPTNGVGLGHAQRAVLIARAMTQGKVTFAAFPSCVPLVQDHGFDCLPLVQKSPDHADAFANDILNYRRLTVNMAAEDLFVFDGGFLFESIARIIAEKGLRAVWVRRGLWQASQLEHFRRLHRGREALFRRIIQPQEAFDELNEPVIYGSPVRAVGPVVQDAPLSAEDKLKVRGDLAERFGRDFGELVITMLGAGQAADRSAQTQTLCGLFERRPDCLHLVVAWPGATIPSGLHGWRNTRVVQTRRALHLAQAADLAVSAAGYNSFHEFLYHGVPAIFIPQMSPFMDDQRRRALAAARRDLAGAVEPEELLRLSREVRAFLDEGRAAAIRASLAAYELPQRGTAAAAALIKAEGAA